MKFVKKQTFFPSKSQTCHMSSSAWSLTNVKFNFVNFRKSSQPRTRTSTSTWATPGRRRRRTRTSSPSSATAPTRRRPPFARKPNYQANIKFINVINYFFIKKTKMMLVLTNKNNGFNQ